MSDKRSLDDIQEIIASLYEMTLGHPFILSEIPAHFLELHDLKPLDLRHLVVKFADRKAIVSADAVLAQRLALDEVVYSWTIESSDDIELHLRIDTPIPISTFIEEFDAEMREVFEIIMVDFVPVKGEIVDKPASMNSVSHLFTPEKRAKFFELLRDVGVTYSAGANPETVLGHIWCIRNVRYYQVLEALERSKQDPALDEFDRVSQLRAKQDELINLRSTLLNDRKIAHAEETTSKDAHHALQERVDYLESELDELRPEMKRQSELLARAQQRVATFKKAIAELDVKASALERAIVRDDTRLKTYEEWRSQLVVLNPEAQEAYTKLLQKNLKSE